MKNIFYVFCLLLISFWVVSSCNKETHIEETFYDDIQGTWVVESSYDIVQFNRSEFNVSDFADILYKGTIIPIDYNSIKMFWNDTSTIMELQSKNIIGDTLNVIGYPFSNNDIEMLTKLE